MSQNGQMAFDFGAFWFKGQQTGTGQAPVKQYNRYLRDLINQGRAKPSWIVSHELPLTRQWRPTSTSTPATRAGPRWCSSPTVRGPAPDDPVSPNSHPNRPYRAVSYADSDANCG